MKTDVVVVGGGPAELGDRGRKVVIVDQEGPQSLGGQAHWSLWGAVHGRHARTASHGYQRQSRIGPERLDGFGAIRPPRGCLSP